jgi:undecaprenyl-diphosphatase
MFNDIQYLLSTIDSQLLLAINGWHCQLSDVIMFLFSDKILWIPLYIMLFVVISRNKSRRNVILWMIAVVVCIVMTDQVTSGLLKPLVCRMRPSNPDNPLSVYIHTVFGYHGGSNGFPSSHAANSAGLTFFWFYTTRKKVIGWLLCGWMLIVCYSRMYLGVHYPSDILVGLIIGFVCARIMAYLYHFLSNLEWKGYLQNMYHLIESKV